MFYTEVFETTINRSTPGIMKRLSSHYDDLLIHLNQLYYIEKESRELITTVNITSEKRDDTRVCKTIIT